MCLCHIMVGEGWSTAPELRVSALAAASSQGCPCRSWFHSSKYEPYNNSLPLLLCFQGLATLIHRPCQRLADHRLKSGAQGLPWLCVLGQWSSHCLPSCPWRVASFLLLSLLTTAPQLLCCHDSRLPWTPIPMAPHPQWSSWCSLPSTLAPPNPVLFLVFSIVPAALPQCCTPSSHQPHSWGTISLHPPLQITPRALVAVTVWRGTRWTKQRWDLTTRARQRSTTPRRVSWGSPGQQAVSALALGPCPQGLGALWLNCATCCMDGGAAMGSCRVPLLAAGEWVRCRKPSRDA